MRTLQNGALSHVINQFQTQCCLKRPTIPKISVKTSENTTKKPSKTIEIQA